MLDGLTGPGKECGRTSTPQWPRRIGSSQSAGVHVLWRSSEDAKVRGKSTPSARPAAAGAAGGGTPPAAGGRPSRRGTVGR